ncbi:BTAD domain-containing putative transcriptional regulator [Actinomadura sp. 7K534]|uniref:BTAD domain-containing putative transcriptional regulator n=1 Tax=Actinomadura sp. 7K534 TaxID=2530366 RepID=UPI00104425F6|nr:BTAD domain-containing putative transcriptional regulator [Actinomadura sp. 7K534]TDB97993.1 helix-turn-helix domain-containing protein [Actinomadura sp. 7K534]
MRARHEFGVLGPLEVRRDGVPLPIGAAKLRLLLAALLVDAGHVVPVDTLVGRLWGEKPPAQTRNTLQNYVLRLRRALGEGGPEIVLTHPRGYLAEVEPDALDLHRFGVLVRQGRAELEAGAADRAAVLLRQALELWRGAPLSDLPPDLLQDVLPTLTEQRLDALELSIDADLALGRAAHVLPELRNLIGTHPLRERFWAQRMRALYQSGRQGEALECYRTVAALLADELGIDPGAELQDLHRRILAAAPELRPAAGPGAGPREHRRGNLPAETTTFVGREGPLAEARRTLGSARLVTLTGVGGVGKTRLALRVAAEAAASFPDGAWLADLAVLAPRTDAEQLDRTVAESLGLRDQSARAPADAVADHLRDRRVLLVLDNCEHLVQAVAALALRLLRAAPGLRILATSRERLGVPGEHVLVVPGLAVPDEEGGERDGAAGAAGCAEAVRLLADRATACAPGFAVTSRNRDAVVQLCRRLDGIPLAIELAAVRLGSLGVAEILDRLDDRFRLLAMPRTGGGGRYRQTLGGVVDWSHELCTAGERLLWARLSVFAGGFDLEAAEAVCTGEGVARDEVMDLLAGLVNKSIVLAGDDSDGRTRYRLLETIRGYGWQRLRERGGQAEIRLRHCRHYRDLAVRAAAGWCGPDEIAWLRRLRRELPDLRAALEFCGGDPEHAGLGLEIAVQLIRARSWFFSGTIGEGRHWLERLSARPDRPPPGVRAHAAAMRAFLVIVQGDRAAVPAAMAACRAEVGPGSPESAYIEGVHALLIQSDPVSLGRLAHAREGFRAEGRPGDALMATMFWAMSAVFLGGRDAAFHACDVFRTDAETARAEWLESWALWSGGLAELRHGDPVRALPLLRDAVVRQRAVEDEWGPVWDVEALAWTAAAVGHHRHAAVLLGAAHRMRTATGVAMIGLSPFQAAHAETVRLVRGALAEDSYADAWSRGDTAEDVAGLVLAVTDEISAAPPGRRREVTGA